MQGVGFMVSRAASEAGVDGCMAHADPQALVLSVEGVGVQSRRNSFGLGFRGSSKFTGFRGSSKLYRVPGF